MGLRSCDPSSIPPDYAKVRIRPTILHTHRNPHTLLHCPCSNPCLARANGTHPSAKNDPEKAETDPAWYRLSGQRATACS